MPENRALMHFTLKDEDMAILDALTTEDDIEARREHELMRKTSL
jgi:diketogulonate reductase-like aldo/keto reductase